MQTQAIANHNDRDARSLFDALAFDGYSRDPGNTIDATVCARASCQHCEATGLDYHAFRRGVSYRAVAQCPYCNFTREF